MENSQSLPLFNSFLSRLANVYNDGLSENNAVMNQDAAFLATKDRFNGFFECHNSFDLIQTYSFVPADDAQWDDAVVEALMSNDYKTLIAKLNVKSMLEKPTAIQVILDGAIEEDGTYIQGGMVLATPNHETNRINLMLSVFTSQGDYDLGISHITESFELDLNGAEPTFYIRNVGGLEDVDQDSFSTFLLMQVPYYLALQQHGYSDGYTHEVMNLEAEDSLVMECAKTQ